MKTTCSAETLFFLAASHLASISNGAHLSRQWLPVLLMENVCSTVTHVQIANTRDWISPMRSVRDLGSVRESCADLLRKQLFGVMRVGDDVKWVLTARGELVARRLQGLLPAEVAVQLSEVATHVHRIELAWSNSRRDSGAPKLDALTAG